MSEYGSGRIADMIPNVKSNDKILPEQNEEWPRYEEKSIFESAVIEASNKLQVSREMAITSALGAMATACQGIIDVEQPTGNRVQTSLMLLTIADSGERKTKLQNQFFLSIRELQRTAYEEGEKAENKYEHEIKIWKVTDSAMESLLKRDIRNNDETKNIQLRIREHQEAKPTRPKSLKLIYEDTTPQALIQMMHEYSRNACMVTSEANSIFSGRALGEINHLNTLWDGGDIIVDRVTKPSIILVNPRLTMALMAQPSVVGNFLKRRGDEVRGMGFLARFLVVSPASKTGFRDYEEIGQLVHLGKFNQRISELLSTSIKRTSDNKKQDVLTFSASASERWKEYSQLIEIEMRDGGIYFYYKDHASKLMDNVSRVAGVIHKFECDDGAIGVKTLEYSYRLCMHYSREFIAHLAGEPTIVTYAGLLVDFFMNKIDKERVSYFNSSKYTDKDGTILINGETIKFNMSEITQYGPNPLRIAENRKQVIGLLTRMGHIKRDGAKYLFSEVIFSWLYVLAEIPGLKNGYGFKISGLPLYDEQRFYQDPRPRGIVNATGMKIIVD